MADDSGKTLAIAAGIAAVIGLVWATSRGGGGGIQAKYKVGDVLHSSDNAADYLIQAIINVSGQPVYYRMIKISDGTITDFSIEQIDADPTWTLVSEQGITKFQIGDIVYDPAAGTFPAYMITEVRTIQGLLRYVGRNYLTGAYWDFPVAIVDASWQILVITGTKFKIGDTIHNNATGATWTILNIVDFGSGPVYMVTASYGLNASAVDPDPNWVLVV